MRSSSYKRIRWGQAARLMAVLAVLAAAGFLFGCAGRTGNRELRIGFLFPESGPVAPYGVSFVEGARLAVAEANRGAGLVVGGRRYIVVLVEKDSSHLPEAALNAAQELINKDGVAAIIGPILSAQAIPVAHLADRARIPMVVQLATNTEVTRGTENVFRVCYTDDFQGEAMALFVLRRLGARSVAILSNASDAYSSGMATILSREIVTRGGRVVASETYATGALDFRAQLMRIKSAHPEVLFLPNFANEIRPQMAQIHELGIRASIVGGDGMGYSNPSYMELIEGAWYSVHFSPDTPGPKAAQFLAAYREVYQRVSDQGAALSYDALALLLQVVRTRQSVDSREIAEGLRRIDTFEGVTGRMVFRGSPDPRKGVSFVRMGKGIARFQTRIEP